MDPSMNIDSLLTAARLLDKGHLLTGLTNLNLAAMPSAVSISTSLPQIVPDVYFQHEFQENLQPSSPGKIKSERKCSTASTSGTPYCSLLQRKTSTKSSRAAHNELEKTRRANLRVCLEKLKTLVPPVSDAARNTTLALLTRARDHIQLLDTANQQLKADVAQEQGKNSLLQAKLERLRAEKARQEESVSTESSQSSRVSPSFLEYSPSTKPSNSPKHVLIIDPYAEGLLPVPFYFNSSKHPFADLNPLPASQNTSYLPIHLKV